MHSLSIPHMGFINKINEKIAKNEEFQRFLQEIQNNPSENKYFQVLNELVFFKGKFFLPHNSPLKQILLEEFHALLLEVHNEIHITFGCLPENVFWVGMRKDAVEFVKNCVVCQQTKPTNPYCFL